MDVYYYWLIIMENGKSDKVVAKNPTEAINNSSIIDDQSNIQAIVKQSKLGG